MPDEFTDVPLPGLDLPAQPARWRAAGLTRRAYSSSLDPTPEAVRRFTSRIVQAPGNGCHFLISAISGVDGYTRDRAELHLVGYSTAA